MDDLADEELIDRLTETGEIRYFEALVQRHIGKVRAMIYPMVLNGSDADDLTQETFLQVMGALPRFRRQARFTTWLYRIVMNTTHNFLRRQRRQPFRETEHIPEPQDQAPDPAHCAAGRETYGEVERALAALPPRLRSAITLTAIHGMPPAEAARAEGCLPATLYWRVHEARRILKKKLGALVTP